MEICSCSCLPRLPGFACSIHATQGPLISTPLCLYHLLSVQGDHYSVLASLQHSCSQILSAELCTAAEIHSIKSHLRNFLPSNRPQGESTMSKCSFIVDSHCIRLISCTVSSTFSLSDHLFRGLSKSSFFPSAFRNVTRRRRRLLRTWPRAH